ncbi:MAG TPA: STAS domain-containing protein [Terriglobales bacterium]|nr:STAS domain-containing protein [Terriglobales bacterium]
MAANPATPSSELHIEKESTPQQTIFHCIGKVNASTSALLQTMVRDVIPQKRPIVLDLSQVSYMDSSGLGALVSVWASARRNGVELKLASLSERVKELLHLTSLDKLFAISRFPDTPSF